MNHKLGITILIGILGMSLFVGCRGSSKDRFCKEKAGIINDVKVQNYLDQWINNNILEAENLELLYESYGPELYIRYGNCNFNWDLIGLKDPGHIWLFGKDFNNIEAIYFARGFRRGILISLREDEQLPHLLDSDASCYRSGKYAVIFQD